MSNKEQPVPTSACDFNGLQRRAEEFLRQDSQPAQNPSPEAVRELVRQMHIQQMALKDRTDELRRAQTELEQTAKRYRDLFHLCPVGYVNLDRNQKIIEANHILAQWLGYQQGELVYQDFLGLLADGYHELFRCHCRQAGPTPQRCDVKLLKCDQTPLSVQLQTRCLPIAEDHDTQYHIAILPHVQDEVLQEQYQRDFLLFREHEQRYAQALCAAQIGSWDWDIQTDTLYWSERIESLFGFTPGQFARTYRAFLECVHPEDRPYVMEAVDACVQEGKTYSLEHRIVWPNGEIHWLSEAGDVFRDEKGNPLRMLGIVQDITELKRAEREQKRLARKLTEKNEDLESIIQVASHDLRSPLITIDGFSDVLTKSCARLRSLVRDLNAPEKEKRRIADIVDREIPKLLGYIKPGVAEMDTILKGLLKLARLGQAALQFEPIDMNALLENIVKAHQFLVDQAHATLEIAPLPPCYGDVAQLTQVFANLLDNAVKYLDPDRPGWIRIYSRPRSHASVYCVEDNGQGIARYNQKLIFKAFYRVSGARTAGEGLGLSVVRRIIIRHGGKVWVRSEPQKGSRFFVALPNRSDNLP